MSRIVSLAAWVAVQAALVAPAAMAQESVKLNMVPLPSTRQQLDVAMDMRMNMSMKLPADATEQAKAQAQQMKASMPITMKMAMRQDLSTTARQPDGGYTLNAEVTSLKNEMRDGTGQTRALPQQGAIRFSARLKDDQFEKIDLQLPPSAQAQALSKEMQEKIFNQSFDWMRKFNGMTLKVGETVEVPIDMNLPTGNAPTGKLLGKYTLTGVNKGVASFDVAVRMDVNFAVPAPASAPSAAAAAPAQGAMSGSGTGKMDLRLADRLMLRSTMAMTMGMDIAGPQGNMRMDMDMTMTSTGKALPVGKKPAAPAKPAPKG
ncbi:hypothetical protein [Mitsuaria sp. GD03876]|uniref:hypothetical protein n=1 Tax=Mitsuaria sp. GD03876 TaxID=2975399 RepID=UPI00244D2D9A|nr:hypothetical protein [Mitsuaria sp. GD03876]MDH0863307.1 hypothetical protein [Mitsuaria sp. GD03876]